MMGAISDKNATRRDALKPATEKVPEKNREGLGYLVKYVGGTSSD